MLTRKVLPAQEALKKEPKEMVILLAKAATAKAEMKSKKGHRKDASSEKKKCKQKGKQALVINQGTKYLPAENRETKNQERPVPKRPRLSLIHHVLSAVPVSLFVRSRSNAINYFVNGNFFSSSRNIF